MHVYQNVKRVMKNYLLEFRTNQQKEILLAGTKFNWQSGFDSENGAWKYL